MSRWWVARRRDRAWEIRLDVLGIKLMMDVVELVVYSNSLTSHSNESHSFNFLFLSESRRPSVLSDRLNHGITVRP